MIVLESPLKTNRARRSSLAGQGLGQNETLIREQAAQAAAMSLIDGFDAAPPTDPAVIEQIRQHREVLRRMIDRIGTASDVGWGNRRVIPDSKISEPIADDTTFTLYTGPLTPPVALPMVRWPLDEYNAWVGSFSAITTLMGLFGPGKQFPLGDGAFVKDVSAAAGLPTIDDAHDKVQQTIVDLQRFMGGALEPLPPTKAKAKKATPTTGRTFTIVFGITAAVVAGGVIIYMLRKRKTETPSQPEYRRRPSVSAYRRGRSGPALALFGTSEECWDLHDKIWKAHRVHENAARQVYEQGIYRKNETRPDAVERVNKLQKKVNALETEWTKKGC